METDKQVMITVYSIFILFHRQLERLTNVPLPDHAFEHFDLDPVRSPVNTFLVLEKEKQAWVEQGKAGDQVRCMEGEKTRLV